MLKQQNAAKENYQSLIHDHEKKT